MNTNIEKAIENLRLNSGRYAKSERYYRGEHDLAFATEKFQNTFGSLFREFAMNLCPAICDAVKDKLRITEFRIEAGNGDITSATRTVWQSNRMGTRAGEIHKEALKNGDAYAIVWPNTDGRVTIYPNKAANITAVFDEESPGKILWAAKYWRTPDKRTRLNLFYPDRIERYISLRESEIVLPEAREFMPVGPQAPLPASHREELLAGSLRSGGDAPHIIQNPFGIVPVFHFANNSDIGTPGQSELEAAIPVQDGLNKSVLDMLVAMEFSAYRQRWAAGIEIEYDNEGKALAPFTAGIDHLWIAQNPNANFGDFEAANLDQFLKVKDSFRIDMASVTGTPLHYLMPHMKGFPSGESLKKAETRFIAKVRDRQESFGQTWADLMSFALMLDGKGKGIRLLTAWEDPAPMSDREALENIVLKKEIGISVEQALLEAGYGDMDIQRMHG
ncbi:MAG: phage portal protein [Blastocatellia bacterium]|nr:phage portal protein [Blastocatellia bacterium]